MGEHHQVGHGRQRLPSGFDMIEKGSDALYRLSRLETDLAEFRNDHKGNYRELQTALSQLAASLQGLQVSMPMTYLTRQDMTERLNNERQSFENRMGGVEKAVTEMQTTMRQLIFAIIAALVSGGIALLIEVLRLTNGGH